MNCKEVTGLLPDYLQGNASPSETAELERHIGECSACSRVLGEFEQVWERLGEIPDEEPGPELRTRFLAALKDQVKEQAPMEGTEPVSPHRGRNMVSFAYLFPRLAAAAVLIAAGFLAGRTTNQSHDIASLNQQVSELKTLVTASIINQQSAITRIEGLSLASGVQDPDEQFLSLLLMTLNTDQDVNVRLAAVSALSNFQSNQWVRQELVKSLARENSPLVQISLIELLVEMREDTALAVFREISDDEQSLDAVRNRARWGIQQLI
jgi:hypothetical protein